MKPVAFDYFAPTNVEGVLSLLQQHGAEAKCLAGGQSLMPMMNIRLARPRYLIDLNRVEELSYIREENGALAIGAMTRQRQIENSDLVKSRCPLLHEATLAIANPTVRNRGTIGGSLVHADPAADLPGALVPLEGELVLQGKGGKRTVKAEDFFIDYLTTSLEPDELLVEVRVPCIPSDTGWAYLKVARCYGHPGLVCSSVQLSLKRAGDICTKAKIALVGVAGKPLRPREAESLLEGKRAEEKLFQQAAERAALQTQPESDIHATAEYRREVAGVLTFKALMQALERAKGGK